MDTLESWDDTTFWTLRDMLQQFVCHLKFNFFLIVYFCTFLFLYSEMIELRCQKKLSKHIFQNHNYCVFSMQCASWQHGWPLRLFEIRFEAAEDATTCIIVSVKKCLNIVAVNGPSLWLNWLFQVQTARGAWVLERSMLTNTEKT